MCLVDDRNGVKCIYFTFTLEEQGIAAGLWCVCFIQWATDVKELTIRNLVCHNVSTKWEGYVLFYFNLVARYSSCTLYWKDFLRVGWTKRILWIWDKWNCRDLSTRGMCKIVYKVFDINKDHNFMSLYIYQIFLPCHAGRARLGCDTNLDSNLISKDVRPWGFSRTGVNFCEFMSEILFIMGKMFILREFSPLQRVARRLHRWNIMVKKFLFKINAFNS